MKNEFESGKKNDESVENFEKVNTIIEGISKPSEETKQPQKVNQKKPLRCRVVDCAKLNVREEPISDATVAGTIERDTIIHVDPVFDENDFKRIVEGPVLGYVKADYLELI